VDWQGPTWHGSRCPMALHPDKDSFAAQLRPTRFLDFHEPAVRAYVEEITRGAATAVEKAKRLFMRVRDDVRYDPYSASFVPEQLSASFTLKERRGFCVTKANLFGACLRAAGIPARVGFADVINHLATKRLIEMMRTDVFVFHGYNELYVGGRWVKATTAFDVKVCQRFGVAPLEFDGLHDAVLQPVNGQGDRFMEYVKDHGTFDDFPFDRMVQAWGEAYPHIVDHATLRDVRGDFEAEAAHR
jgi:transglutaminase-like putative cysteine protease